MKKLILLAALLVATPAHAEGRPKGCPHAWCGCWMSMHVFGKNIRDLWLARNWLKFPRTDPHAGAIAVLSRGRRGGGHVGVVIRLDANGNPVIKSGNHGGRVGVGTYPKSRVLAYVQP